MTEEQKANEDKVATLIRKQKKKKCVFINSQIS